MSKIEITPIPTRLIGPIRLTGDGCQGEFYVPMATYETTLWPSCQRGAKVTRLAGGIEAMVLADHMSRSVTVETASASQSHKISQFIQQQQAQVAQLISENSRFARLEAIHIEQVGCLLYIRIAIQSGEASGHNMVTKAADSFLQWLLAKQPHCRYVSISGNYCTDKKVSAVNGILGRGKRVVAECTLNTDICEKYLRVTPAQICDLNLKKNYIGSNLAGSLRSANAHFANTLLAIYLATGQDAANIIEGSQGLVHSEVRGDNLYFSVTMPNIIIGTVGNGKHHKIIQDRLQQMQLDPNKASEQLAAIIGATVLCAEISLLAAQCNPGELTRSHMLHERQNRVKIEEP